MAMAGARLLSITVAATLLLAACVCAELDSDYADDSSSVSVLASSSSSKIDCTTTINGDYYDFSGLMNNGQGYSCTGASPKGPEWYHFTVSICEVLSTSTCQSTGASPDGAEITVCQAWNQIDTKGNNAMAGILSGASFEAIPSEVSSSQGSVPIENSGAMLKYTGGSGGRSAQIYLICSKGKSSSDGEQFSWIKDNTQGNTLYQFKLYSPHACPTSPPDKNKGGGGKGGLSGGSWFLIALLIVTVLYVSIGSVYKWKMMGAQGLEIIPQVDFWKDLPFLVKDGVMFVVGMFPCMKGGYSKV